MKPQVDALLRRYHSINFLFSIFFVFLGLRLFQNYGVPREAPVLVKTLHVLMSL